MHICIIIYPYTYIYIYIYLYNTQIIWDSNKFACTTKIFILISVFL